MFWLYGLCNSEKFTLANLLSERVKPEGHLSLKLEGHSLGATKNSVLGFTDKDPRENIMHAAHMTHPSCQNKNIIIASFIDHWIRFEH